MKRTLFLLALTLLTMFVAGCGEQKPDESTKEETTVTTTTGTPDEGSTTGSTEEPTTELHSPRGEPPVDGEEVAVLETNFGQIVLKFFPDKAPRHVKNFKDLAKKGFYNGTKFHRVIPGFMIQGGDQNSKDDDRANDGSGGPGYEVPGEMNDYSHVRGSLSMARSPDPNSAGSQFFIVHQDSKFLDKSQAQDGFGYTLFGEAVSGMDVVDKIVNLKRDSNDNPLESNPAILKSVKIVTWPIK